MIYLILSIIFMVLLAVVTRKAVQSGCNAFCFNAIARYLSGFIMLVFTMQTVRWESLLSAFKSANVYGVLGAFFFTAATIGATKSVQYGPLGISWTILRCSMIVPTLASLFYWREIPAGGNSKFIFCVLGIFFILSTVIFFGISKTLRRQSQKHFSLKWLAFVMLAFFGQGGWEILLRSTRQVDIEGFRGAFITLVFLISAIYCTPALRLIGKKNWKKELFWGIVFGFCGIFASASRVWALRDLDGTIVFPVTTIGVTLSVQVISVVFFKERPEKLDYIAYASSICGISCIALM